MAFFTHMRVAYAIEFTPGLNHWATTRQKSLLAESHRKQAEHCCRCNRCDKQIDNDDIHNICNACLPAYEEENKQAKLRWLSMLRAEESARDKSLEKSVDKIAALSLRDTMSAISEDFYCAQWLDRLEFSLWNIMISDSRKFGFGEVDSCKLNELRSLHDKCGGWWMWSDFSQTTIFVTTNEWNEILGINNANQ